MSKFQGDNDSSCSKKCVSVDKIQIRVGALEHEFYAFSFSREFHHPNWLGYFFKGVGIPPTRIYTFNYILCIHLCKTGYHIFLLILLKSCCFLVLCHDSPGNVFRELGGDGGRTCSSQKTSVAVCCGNETRLCLYIMFIVGIHIYRYIYIDIDIHPPLFHSLHHSTNMCVRFLLLNNGWNWAEKYDLILISNCLSKALLLMAGWLSEDSSSNRGTKIGYTFD